MEQKPNRVKYKVGYKKLKNVNLFEEFAANVSEANSTFKRDVDDLFYDLNKLHLLLDEGYLEDNAAPKASIEDINTFLEQESGEKGFFTSEEDLQRWIGDIAAKAEKFAKLWK